MNPQVILRLPVASGCRCVRAAGCYPDRCAVDAVYTTDDMLQEPLTLCWTGQPLGQITEATWSDWPWASGTLVIGKLPADLRAVLEWFSRQADSDNLEDPPFHKGLLDGWSIVAADGVATEIGVPVVDFESGTIEWR